MSFLPSFPRIVPSFPQYRGPFKVGTLEYEIPISELPSTSEVPDASISTIKFRAFYPSVSSDQAAGSHVSWLPEPQTQWFKAYCTFLSAPPKIAAVLSRLPLPLKYAKIPATRSAALRSKDGSDKWPVLIFSHGLGGSYNTYSHLLGSLASCGIFCIAPEHRDGSAPISMIQKDGGAHIKVPYQNIPHDPTPEILAARNSQLRIRLWELDLLYSALVKLNDRGSIKSLDPHARDTPSLRDRLDLRPSKVTWAGHSFGAATVIQLIKSVYWQQRVPNSERQTNSYGQMFKPLCTPTDESQLKVQITPESPLALLDPWLMALRGEPTAWLYEKPLPCFERQGANVETNVIAILSDQFYKWTGVLDRIKAVLSSKPVERVGSGQLKNQVPGAPLLFYAPKTAHLNQSDFGLLFPWATKTWLKAEEPERTILFNSRAILQILRKNKISVEGIKMVDTSEKSPNCDDPSILAKEGVQGWISIDI